MLGSRIIDALTRWRRLKCSNLLVSIFKVVHWVKSWRRHLNSFPMPSLFTRRPRAGLASTCAARVASKRRLSWFPYHLLVWWKHTVLLLKLLVHATEAFVFILSYQEVIFRHRGFFVCTSKRGRLVASLQGWLLLRHRQVLHTVRLRHALLLQLLVVLVLSVLFLGHTMAP